MTLSTDYSNCQIYFSSELPESLCQIIEQAWKNHYEELYEEAADGNIILEETLLEILDALGDKENSLSHDRYVRMALILGLAVEPTIKAYLPKEQQTEQTLQLVINWFENQELPTEETINQLFSQKSVGSQAIDEALDVLKNLLQVLNPNKAQEALLEILDDCLEGYAIFPGSQGRRDVFNWWLLEVVPATWLLQVPESIYTIKGIVPLDTKTLPSKLLTVFDTDISQEIIKSNNNYQQIGKNLYEKLNINIDETSFEQLPNYTAVEYFLNIEDESSSNATNLTKVNRYLESFNHLCEVEDWKRASEIIFFPLNTPTQEEFHNQLGTWGYYKEQINLCSKLLNKLTPKLNSTLLYGIGNALFAIGNYQQALDFYQQSMEIDEKIGNRVGVGMCLGGIGIIYYCQGDYNQAINYHQKHLEIAKEVKDIQGEAYANGNLGNIYHHIGEYQKAINYYEQTLSIAKTNHDLLGQEKSLGNLGVVHKNIGNNEKAIECYQESLEIAKITGNLQEEGKAIGNLGIIYLRLKDYIKAIKHFEQRLKIAKDTDDSAGKVIAYGNLALVYKATKNYDRAVDYCQKSIEISQLIGDTFAEGATRQNLAAIFMEEKKYSDALINLQTALQIIRKISVSSEKVIPAEAVVLKNLAEVYIIVGELDIAQDFCSQALMIAEKLQLPLLEEYRRLKQNIKQKQRINLKNLSTKIKTWLQLK